MDADALVIQHGLPEQHWRRAAEIYYDAFEDKIGWIMSREHGVLILEKVFDPECAIVALSGDALAGIAGLHYGGSQMVTWRYAVFVEEFGYLRGLLKGTMIRLFRRSQRKGQLLMDGLAVDAPMRGRGIGTALIEAVCDFARERGFTSVRLDVVDTNPRARRLYERLGFVPTKTHRYPVMRRFIGFSGHTTMVKTVT